MSTVLSARVIYGFHFSLSKTIEINHRIVLNELTSKIPLSRPSNTPQLEVVDEEVSLPCIYLYMFLKGMRCDF